MSRCSSGLRKLTKIDDGCPTAYFSFNEPVGATASPDGGPPPCLGASSSPACWNVRSAEARTDQEGLDGLEPTLGGTFDSPIWLIRLRRSSACSSSLARILSKRRRVVGSSSPR